MKKIIKIIAFIIGIIGLLAFIRDRFEQRRSAGRHRYKGLYEKYVKRPLDAMLSAFALIVFSPVMIITGVLVKKNLGSPVFFTQDRPGKDAKVFKLYKFRTMKEGDLPDSERLTPFGEKLRSTSLDELPELFNILKGDMAIVGPRPLLVRYLSRYNKTQARRHEVRPGLTGLAQANGRNALSWQKKFDYDVKYVDNVTFTGDVKIIADTVKEVISKEGVSEEGEATMEEFMGDGSGV